MIITCNNCNKNFYIEASLIPEKGRLLQCNGCNHKWFFKKESINPPITKIKSNTPQENPKIFKEKIDSVQSESSETIELLEKPSNDNYALEKISIKDKTRKEKDIKEDVYLTKDTNKNKKKYTVLSLIIIFIISFIALMFVLDTFKVPISKIYPNIEHILYSLYETINDIWLFFIDLI